MDKNILDKLLCAIATNEDGTISLTILDGKDSATIKLKKEIAERLGMSIIHCAQLLSVSEQSGREMVFDDL